MRDALSKIEDHRDGYVTNHGIKAKAAEDGGPHELRDV
jgi:hypothetical protein